MTSEKSRKSFELGSGGGPRRSDVVVAAEKSLSEVSRPDNENEKHPRGVIEDTLQYATAIFDSAGGAKADDEFSARTPQWRWTATRNDNGQTAEILAAAELYACDRGTVQALAHTQLAPGDRTTVDAWLDKLDECSDSDVRSQYAEFLLRAVAGGNMRVEPFWGRSPPGGPLRRLGQRDAHSALLSQQYSGQRSTRPDPALQRATPTTRQTFYERQPMPEDGTICYAAAFSDMF